MRDLTPTWRELAYFLIFAGNLWLLILAILRGYP
jgi:hypothetical protein